MCDSKSTVLWRHCTLGQQRCCYSMHCALTVSTQMLVLVKSSKEKEGECFSPLSLLLCEASCCVNTCPEGRCSECVFPTKKGEECAAINQRTLQCVIAHVAILAHLSCNMVEFHQPVMASLLAAWAAYLFSPWVLVPPLLAPWLTPLMMVMPSLCACP